MSNVIAVSAEPPDPSDPVTVALPPEARPRTLTRVTVREDIYFQKNNEQPAVLPTPLTWRDGAVDEQPCVRHMTVGGAWVPLDLGWFADRPGDVGMLVVANRPVVNSVRPTPEQAAAQRSCVLEVAALPPPLAAIIAAPPAPPREGGGTRTMFSARPAAVPPPPAPPAAR